MTEHPIQRTLILSDLHLGNGGPYDTYAGGDALPPLLDELTARPTRVVINGDGLDFLMNEDPMVFDPARAAEQARALVAWGPTAEVLRALGRTLARGGEVIFRVGNHDPELAAPEVQAVIRAALDQPESVADRLRFTPEAEPGILEVGGARVLVTHGEHDDLFNMFDHDAIPSGRPFRYTPGSKLVKLVLNRVIREFRLPWVNFLKPDFTGALMCGIAVEPRCLEVAWEEHSADNLKALLQNANPLRRAIQAIKEGRQAVPAPAPEGDEGSEPVGPPDVFTHLKEAKLSPAELKALLRPRFLEVHGVDVEDPDLVRARMKVGRLGARMLGGMHKRISGDGSRAFFTLKPTGDEWKDASRMARRHEAQAVLYGHTHAARFRRTDALTFVNTGTWTWLIGLPPADAPDELWHAFIGELSANRELHPARQLFAQTQHRLTAALLEPVMGGGAQLSLVEWSARGLETLASSRLRPADEAGPPPDPPDAASEGDVQENP